MLITDAVTTPIFSHHETFHLRYGWLKKAYNQINVDGRIFLHDNATIKLGVGKNMVRAIRFWAMANKIITASGTGKNMTMIPTDMGHAIFSNKGLDPYLEKPDTLWLLHWLLFAPPCSIPVWWIVMNEFAATNIKIDDVTESVISRITNISEWKTPSPKSIKKDIDVFIHTYTTKQAKMSMEDYLDCPFRQLHMVKQISKDMMRFVFGKKYGLSPLMVAFACLDFIDKAKITSKSVSVSRLATEPGSVGNIFKIGENDIAEMLREASDHCNLIKIDNVNGTQHLMFDSAQDTSMEILSLIYKKPVRKLKQKVEALTH